MAITIISIMTVLFWYRLKAMIKQKRKKKKLFDQQRHFNSPVINNNHHHNTIAIRYTSTGTLASVRSACEPSKSQSLNAYQNFDVTKNDPVSNFIDDKGS